MPAHSSPHSSPPPVPGYRLDRLLGRGGSGEVWEAVARTGGEPVAIKLLVSGDAARQVREAELLGELDHPHLVRLIEVVHLPRRGEEPGVALVLEFLGGGSLAALLARRGRLRPGEVVTAIAPVAAALAHAHAVGIVHGDLSPANIVFTAEGRPVLTDLGVARLLGDTATAATEQTERDATPAYVDPTVARGGATGPASDVFGIAAAAFHALTGIAPWNAATPAGTAMVAAAGELPDLDLLAPEAPTELRAVIARGLAPEPHQRGTAAALALDLRHTCRPEPVQLAAQNPAHEDGAGAARRRRAELTHHVAGRRTRATLEPQPARRRRSWGGRRSFRALAVALVLAVGAGAAVWIGSLWAGDAEGAGASRTVSTPQDPAPAEPLPPLEVQPDPASAAEWQAHLQDLYAQRALAFATADVTVLAAVYAPPSTLLAADRSAVAALAAAGEVLVDFAPEVVSVETISADAGGARLRVVDRWPGYRVVPAGDAMAVGQPVAGRAESMVIVELVSSPQGWRILSGERSA